MPVSIYNSLTRKKEPFEPLKPAQVNIYTCGVTVYDDCHIGHARSLYIFDVIRRYLKYRGFQVNFVRNITDIDDKIINKAKQEKVDFGEITRRYIDSYYRDIRALGIEKADFEPRATENIPDMVKHIQGLIAKEYAYVVGGDVYFSVRKFKDYGKLSGQSIDQMLEAVRVEKKENKQDPLDFALWKKSEEDEPGWDSPWGRGRPGWHIECSVMSAKYLKTETLDIHAGGRDLIFPHHENEIAQAEALAGKPFAKYWIHHGLLTINGQKMAKSAGNFITIQDAIKKYGAEELKLFFLSSLYASPIDFSEERMIDAHKRFQRIKIFVSNAKIIWGKEPDDSNPEIVERYKENFFVAMDDDFNTPKALGIIFDLINEANKFLGSKMSDLAADFVKNVFINIFGISIKKDDEEGLGGEELLLLDERETARKNGDFKCSDELREELRKRGIIVEDTKDGQKIRKL
jgi:cysteinyl-tRNA synthetase